MGDAACAPCHGTIVEDYHRHPMAQSIAAVHHARSVERYDAAAHNPFQYAGVQYRVEPRKDGLVHSETLIDATGRVLAGTTASIALVVGSGQNGRAYLVQRNDALFASPIAWYPRKQQWDLAPGYDKQNPHFGRPIGADCLFCHANAADPIPGAANRYRSPQLHAAAIGCERCHGPGELHVERREKSEAVTGLDDAIVNPARLAHDLREDVCQQCHLQGQQRVVRRGLNPFDFRPGLPAPLFYSDFIKSKRDGPVAFVGAVEQMTTSVCYQKSAAKVNRMGCISCHDPHRLPKPEAKIAYYRERCQNCHERNGCSLPLPARIEKNADNCVACHMPPTGSSINHTTITDHRIVRRRDSSRDAPKRNDTTAFSLVHFHRDRVDPHDPEAERDLAIATVQYADSLPSGDALRTMLEQVLPLLDAACARDETDLPAREARGNALWFLGRLDEALETYERVLRDHADREMTRYQAATLSLRLGRLESARDHAERAVALDPGAGNIASRRPASRPRPTTGGCRWDHVARPFNSTVWTRAFTDKSCSRTFGWERKPRRSRRLRHCCCSTPRTTLICDAGSRNRADDTSIPSPSIVIPSTNTPGSGSRTSPRRDVAIGPARCVRAPRRCWQRRVRPRSFVSVNVHTSATRPPTPNAARSMGRVTSRGPEFTANTVSTAPSCDSVAMTSGRSSPAAANRCGGPSRRPGSRTATACNKSASCRAGGCRSG